MSGRPATDPSRQISGLASEEVATRAVQQLVVHRRAVVDEHASLSNHHLAQLKQYYPQALTLCGEDLRRPLATVFLLKWPRLQAEQIAKSDRVKGFYHRHGSQRTRLQTKRLALVAKEVVVTVETAVIGSFVLRVQLLWRQLHLLQRGLINQLTFVTHRTTSTVN